MKNYLYCQLIQTQNRKAGGINMNLWLMEATAFQEYQEKLASFDLSEEKLTNAFDIFKDQTADDLMSIDGDTATVEIIGVLTANGPSPLEKLFGISGTSFNALNEAFEDLKNNDEIKNVNLIMNTPGGEALPTDKTFQKLKELSAVKNVVAENHGIIASAGYWIALAANEIVATSPINLTGSIGTVLRGLDSTRMLNNMGIDRIEVVSKNAPKKKSIMTEPKNISVIQEEVDALERVFIHRVAENRNTTEKNVRDNFGEGGLLIAQDPDKSKPDALSVGMIDRVENSISKTVNNKSNNKVKTQEEKNMTLKEFLAANPDAKAKYDADIKAAEDKGFDAGSTKNKARNEYASKFLTSEAYPPEIHALAAQVITGDVEQSALVATVTNYDIQKQQKSSAEAAKATKNSDETLPTAPDDPKAEEGVATDAKSAQEMINKNKASQGIEV